MKNYETKAVWEPVIKRDLFDQAQEILEQTFVRKFIPEDPNRYPFILSGVLVCSQCGERLCGKTANNGKGYKFAYYEHGWATKKHSCLVKKEASCNPNRIQASVLEPAVWAAIEGLLSNESIAKALL